MPLADAALDLTRTLVGIDSVNPGLVPGAAGEATIADYLADRLDAAGFDVSLVAPVDHLERVSVLAVRELGPGPTVLLNGHLDTVGVEGMDDPFTARIDGDRMYGRGTCDMKAGLAGMVVAAESLAGTRSGRLVLAFTADEEDDSLGTEAVLPELRGQGLMPDVAVVGEPTWLDLAVAHRGFALMRADLQGRAVHTSQPQQGIDAIAHLGRLLTAVAEHDARLRAVEPHTLLGHGSMLVSVVEGGSAPFTIAAHAHALVERRTLPGESTEQAVAELQALIDALAGADPEFSATVAPVIAREAWESRTDGAAALLGSLLAEALPGATSRVGAPYWMESALFEGAGIPAVVCGPAGGSLHAIDEWVDIPQVRAYPVALAAAVERFLAG